MSAQQQQQQTQEQQAAFFRSIADGSKVQIKFVHVRDRDHLRTIRGPLMAHRGGWVVTPTATQRFKFPNNDAQIIDVQVLEAATRAPSTSLPEELVVNDLQEHFFQVQDVDDPTNLSQQFNNPFSNSDDVVIEVQDEYFEPQRQQRNIGAATNRIPRTDNNMPQGSLSQNPRHQPNGERTTSSHHSPSDFAPSFSHAFNSMTTMMAQQNRMFQVLLERGLIPNSNSAPPAVQQQNVQQDDVGRLLMMTDALRGQDNPTWRLVGGLLLPRFIPEQFEIVSIPHLLFRENPVTGEMIRVPIGTALPHYRSILGNAKLKFPNQVNVRLPTNPKDSKHHTSDDSSAGVRLQIDRAERMFVELLNKIDNTDTASLPSSKSEWMLFIDAGVLLLDLYATLAFGFIKGGAKLSNNYANMINTGGKFDPAKLWSDMATPNSFRNP